MGMMRRIGAGSALKVMKGMVPLTLAMSSSVGLAKVDVAGFTEMGYESDDKKVTGDSRHEKGGSFYIGDIDIFLQGSLGDNFYWLSETAFSAGPDNFTGIDVERAIISYKPKDYFNVSLGRFHTALGYWNDTYHHGSWLATSVARPYIYNFEDANGILPIHSVGLEIRGVFNSSFGYLINLANGRGATPSPVQISSDGNNNKASNLLVYWNTPLKGLRVGAGYYRDKIPLLNADTSNASSTGGFAYAPHNGASEGIADAHIVYKGHNIEFINEYHQIVHKYDHDNTVAAQNDVKTTVTSYFSQLGYQIHEVYTPYVRTEAITGDKKNDEWYLADAAGNPLGKNLKHTIHSVGIRYDLSDVVALKFELAQDKLSNFYGTGYAPAGPGGKPDAVQPVYSTATQTTNAVRANVSFAF